MLEINTARYAGDYRIDLVFNDGKQGTADLKETIFSDARPIFSRLRERASFADFKVAHSTVVWSDELDMAAEYLYFITFKGEPDLQERFRIWGYIA